jgi:hypothetical protein
VLQEAFHREVNKKFTSILYSGFDDPSTEVKYPPGVTVANVIGYTFSG